MTSTKWICVASVAASVGLSGCLTDEAVLDGAGETESFGDDGALPAHDAVPIKFGARSFIERLDGSRIPLLRPDEMERPVAGAVGPSVPGPTYLVAPATADLSAYQTPIKNQLDRGTCGSFATVAAIEAAYKRTWGLTLNLSEQYMFHVAKSTGVSYPRIYQYENQSSYWYGGGWPQTDYWLPLESDAPYAGYTGCPAGAACTPLNSIPGASALVWAASPADNRVTQKQVDDWEYSPLHIPANARNNARYGITSFTNYDTAQSRDTALLESLIASQKEVVISVDLKWVYGADSVYHYSATGAGGGHVFLLIGYNRSQGWFLVKNSWGESGYLKVGYDFIRNASFGAAVVNAVVPPSAGAQAKAKWMGKWVQDHDGWPGTLVIRRLTNPANAPTRLGTYYASGAYTSGHSANGLSIDADRGLRYYVAAEVENAPGALTGQRFEADQYDSAPTHAAGSAWFGTDGIAGLHLGRAALPMVYSNTFSTAEWVGTWDLDLNGTRSVLAISAVTATAGDYNLSATVSFAGTTRAVTGTLERARPGIAHLVIDGANVTLRYHFWEDKLASGFTLRTGYARAGAHAVRR